jgi:hypothetical protein
VTDQKITLTPTAIIPLKPKSISAQIWEKGSGCFALLLFLAGIIVGWLWRGGGLWN